MAAPFFCGDVGEVMQKKAVAKTYIDASRNALV